MVLCIGLPHDEYVKNFTCDEFLFPTMVTLKFYCVLNEVFIHSDNLFWQLEIIDKQKVPCMSYNNPLETTRNYGWYES